MTAAVPDPRFRDQLAEALCEQREGPRGWEYEPGRPYWQKDADALLPMIAAEVESRIQAAANQRAEEVVEPGLSVESNGRRLVWFTDDELAAELNRRAAALAHRAPAPRAEEGQ